MHKRIILLVLIVILTVACRSPAGTSTPATLTPSPTPTSSRSSIPTVTPVAMVNSTITASPTVPPTHTASPTLRPTLAPTPFLPDVLTGPVDLRQPIGSIPWYRSDGLWLVDPETGDLQRAQMAAEVAAWSPDGNALAVLEPPRPGQDAPADARILTLYDLTTGQRSTYPNVHLAPHSGVAWQTVKGAFVLYALPATAPGCLLCFDLSRGEFQQVLCAEEKGKRFAGDLVALLDGRLAHVAITDERVSLRLIDPAIGAAQNVALWAGSDAASALRVPLALSPDGRHLAALRGPAADPDNQQIEQQGLYLLDMDAGLVEQAFTEPGLRWMIWSPDGTQLAMAGDTQRFGVNAIHLYDRATGDVRSLYEAVGLDITLMASGPASAYPAGVPLAWISDGRLLVGLHPPSHGSEVVHPRLAWVDPATEGVTFALPFGREPGDWPIYIVQEVGLAVRYPPGWTVLEWQAHGGDGFALGSASWVPARYANVDQPQIPNIHLALYRPPLTGTLEAWLDAHGTTASFGMESGEQIGFWGVGDAVPAAAGGYPALRFTHEAFGLRVHELLLAIGDRVVGLGYTDFGGEDLGLAFTHMHMELGPAEVVQPAGWESKGDLADRLVVEEYPIVAQDEDSPGRFEYLDRIGDDILDRRQAWRQAPILNGDDMGDLPPVEVNGETISLRVDSQHSLLTVSAAGRPIYAMTVPWPWVDDPVKTFLVWREHWVLEADEKVIVNGHNLNRVLGYDAIFYWRLVQDRPFFFFRQGDTYGISYDEQVLSYRYDHIVHYMCCEPATFNAAGNETMVWFHALRDGMWYYIEMGVYE